MAGHFDGFPREGMEFLDQLRSHNNRQWFLAHKDVYERCCRMPMEALAVALEPRFGKARISRINRDMRFSRDGAPYKTYIAAGIGGRYISLSGTGLFVGAGLYKPEPPMLQRFRAAIADDTTGRELDAMLTTLRRDGYEVGSHHTLTSAPRGYTRDHPRIELLQMKDIFAGRMFAPSAWLGTARALERIERVMSETGPLVDWVQRNVTGTFDTARSRGRNRPTTRAHSRA